MASWAGERPGRPSRGYQSAKSSSRHSPSRRSLTHIAAIGHYPQGRGILGLLIREPDTLRLTDLTAHPDATGFPAGHPPMRSFLSAPVRGRKAVFGNLYLTNKRGGAEFDADDEAVLATLAAAAGVAIDNARLYDAVQRRERWLTASG
ncbi:GAF domain-containing protein [Streptomyces sp. NPDC047461]|uniref:GAF domain-containing protein n=1 Tax=Streptomyces sp. NPDC047461 TaxID=3155619 RepID=UPI0033F0FD08